MFYNTKEYVFIQIISLITDLIITKQVENYCFYVKFQNLKLSQNLKNKTEKTFLGVLEH